VRGEERREGINETYCLSLLSSFSKKANEKRVLLRFERRTMYDRDVFRQNVKET